MCSVLASFVRTVIDCPQEAVQRCALMDAFVSGDIDAAKVSVSNQFSERVKIVPVLKLR